MGLCRPKTWRRQENLGCQSMPLEVVDILITEDVKNLTTVTRQAFDMKIKVAAIPDLITLKKKSGRPQDIEDIRVLEKLL